MTYSGKYPALPWLPILLHPASPYPTIVYTMLPKHIPPCLNLLSYPARVFDSNQAETSYLRDRNSTEPKTIQTVRTETTRFCLFIAKRARL